MNHSELARHVAGYDPAISSKSAHTSAADSLGQEEDTGAASLILSSWYALKRRKRAVLGCVLAGYTIAAVLTLPARPVYRARTSLEMQGINDNFLNMKSVDPTNPLLDFTPDGFIQTQVRILGSERLLTRTKDRLRGRHAGGKQAIPTRAYAGFRREAIPFDSMLAEAARSVQARVMPATHIIEVFCDSVSPELASEFANALVNEFIEHNRESRWKVTQDTGDWLTRQLRDLRAKLEQSESQLQLYARSAGLEFASDRTTIGEERLRQLQLELSKAQADRVLKQSAYDLVKAGPGGALPEISDTPALREYQSKLVELNRERAEATATMTPANVRVRKVDAQIAELETAVKNEQRRIIRKIEDEYRAAKGRESLLSASYREQSRSLSDQALRTIRYDVLRHEVDTNRQLYEAMLQRVKEAGITAAMKASNVSVVDIASPPDRAFRPDLLWNGTLGLIGGFAFGIVFVMLTEQADRSIRNPGETGRLLNIPELGTIPTANLDRIAARGRPLLQAPEGRTALSVPHVEPWITPELAMCGQTPSLMTESFRGLLASLLSSSGDSKKAGLFVVSSASPSEGKTTIATNMAIAMAETRRRVLLVDGDLRRPALEQLFTSASSGGLRQLLESERPIGETDINLCIRFTGVRGLELLVAGDSASRVADLLYSPRLPELMQLLRQRYDAVIIDTPPMMQMPDARILARHSDGVILVIRSRRTTREAATSVAERLQVDRIPVIGTILNDWDPGRTAQYDYQNYAATYHRDRPSTSG